MKFHNYYFYITTNSTKTVLYAGVTNDLDRRLWEHENITGDQNLSFAQKYHCFHLIYYEWYDHIRDAIAREKEVKGWSRLKKTKLISTFNPDWRFLNSPVEIEKGNLPIWYAGDEYWRPSLDKVKRHTKEEKKE